MKRKDIVKYYKRRIVSGWREYLDLKFPYDLLGLNGADFLTKKDICDLTGLVFDKEESGFVDHYNMLDMNHVHNGQPLNVMLELCWEYLREETVEKHFEKSNFLPANTVGILDDGKVYYCRGRAGYKNPEWNVDLPNDSKVPYWLYADDKNLRTYEWTWLRDTDEEGNKRIEELLRKYINTKRIGSDLFSGDMCYGLVSGNFGQNITNELVKDLSGLAEYCKTTYEEPCRDYLKICYAIRYKSNVKPFLKELKRISIKHNLNKL